MDPGPVPDVLLQQLEEALSLESKYQPSLQLPSAQSEGENEVTIGIRDGSVHVLRCLKVWYDMPADVFFAASNLMDRFLTKMKVRPKHMSCISAAAFNLGCRAVLGDKGPDTADILTISQCKCTLGDLDRMTSVISTKLGEAPVQQVPINCLTFLKLLHALILSIDNCAIYSRVVDEQELIRKLEVLVCDASCSNFRASELALVLICHVLDCGIANLTPAPPAIPLMSIITFIGQLQKLCQITERSFCGCHGAVVAVMERYNGESQFQHRQRLEWRLSRRTLKWLRPTLRMVSTLPTIDEHGQLVLAHPQRSDSWEEDWDMDQ